MGELLLTVRDDLSVRASQAALRYLADAQAKGRTDGRPWLFVSRPTDRAVLLGRFQSVRSVALEACRERGLAVIRRVTGGSLVAAGPETVHFGLVFRYDEGPLDATVRQILQKYGLVVTSFVAAVAGRARYYGRELVSVDDVPVALCSFELDQHGVATIEGLVGLGESIWPDVELRAPDRTKRQSERVRPLAAELPDVTAGQLLEAGPKAVAEALGLDVRQRDFLPLELERVKLLERRVLVSESEEDLGPIFGKRWRSQPVAEVIGYVEAIVGVAQGRFLTDVRIFGDFLADSPGIRALEERLRMCPVERRQVAVTIDEVLGAPNHVILGIRRLGSILDAILDAAGKAAAKAE